MPVREAGSSSPAGDLTKLFQQARQYLDNEQPEKSIEMLAPLLGIIGSSDYDCYLCLRRLLASAYTKANRFHEAQLCAEEGLKLCPDGLDFLFALAINSAIDQRFDRTIEYCQKYLRLWDQKDLSLPKNGRWDSAFALRHQILTAYGIALIEAGQPDGAEKCFREAIHCRPDYDSSYVNLSMLLVSQDRKEEAVKVAKQGVAAIPNSVALNKIADSAGERATISVCMIVKNEEQLLPRCLKSIRNLADEIVLVDTGSEDKTVQIAEEFGCKIYHFPWPGDFSSARNESLKHVTKDWIFIIDADEELPPEEVVKTRFFTALTDAKIISISVYNKSLETGKISSFLPSVRLFRRELGLYYKDIVHNRLVFPPGVLASRRNIRLFHYGYDLSCSKLDKKLNRTKALLEKQLEESPDDIFANFNMAQLLLGYGAPEDTQTCQLIIKHADRVITNHESRSGYFGQYIMAFIQKAIALISLGNYNDAEKLCFEALEEKPGYLDALMTLGHIYMDTKQYEKARESYHQYLDCQEKYRADNELHSVILRHLDSRHIAWYALGRMASSENKTDEALQAFHQAVEDKASFRDVYCQLGRLYLDKKDAVNAEAMFRKQIEADANSMLAHLGLGEAISRRGDEAGSLEHFQRAAQLAPDNCYVQLCLSKTMIKLGQVAEGWEHLKKLLQMAPEQAEINYRAGDLAFEIGEMEAAIAFYNQVLRVQPSHIKSLNNLGNCYVRIRQYEKACSTYERLLNISPEYTLAYRNLGVAYARLGNNEKALTALMEYSKDSPKDDELYGVIGDLFFALGYFDESIGCYEKYLSRHPQDHDCILHLSEAYLNLGFVDSAVIGLKRVLAIDPTCQTAMKKLQSLTYSETVV